MVTIFFAALGLFLFAFNMKIMFWPLKPDSPWVQSRMQKDPKTAAKLLEVLDADAIWRDIGRHYQFLSVPAQALVLFVTMSLQYFGYLGKAGAYVSIGLLVVILVSLLIAKPGLVGRISEPMAGSALVQKMLTLGVRSSISFAAAIIYVCLLA